MGSVMAQWLIAAARIELSLAVHRLLPFALLFSACITFDDIGPAGIVLTGIDRSSGGDDLTLPTLTVSGPANSAIRIDWRSAFSETSGGALNLRVLDALIDDNAPGVLGSEDDGALLYDPAGAFDSLPAGAVGVISITMTIVDEQGRAGQPSTVAVNVLGVNEPPLILPDESPSASTLDTLLIDVVANDSDIDAGDTLTLSSVSSPILNGVATGSASLDAGHIRFTPAHPQSGEYVIAYTITDASGATASASVTVVVRFGYQVSIDSFTSSRAKHIGGQPAVTLSWSTSNAHGCTLSGGGEVLSSATSGDTAFAPTQPEPPTLSCSGDGGPVTVSLPWTFQPALLVDDITTGNNDGTTWENAFRSVQQAIDSADNQGGVEIWVKAGTYRPATATAPVASLNKPTTIRGGFSQDLFGTNGDPASRSPDSDETVFDGCFDPQGQASPTNDAWSVVHAESVEGPIRLDGLTITRGQGYQGGGIFVSSCSDVAIDGTRVIANTVNGSGGGGGLYASNSTIAITHTLFDGNRAEGFDPSGGGIRAEESTLTLSSCTLTHNVVQGGDAEGGAIYLQSTDLTLSQSVIADNSALGGVGSDGPPSAMPCPTPLIGGRGGHARGGGIFMTSWIDQDRSIVRIINQSVISGNKAQAGAGGRGTDGCGNTAGTAGGIGGYAIGGGLAAKYAQVEIDHSSVSNNVAQGGQGGAGGRGFYSVSAGNGGNGDVGHGGGLDLDWGYIGYPSSVTMVLSDATLSGNQALGGDGGNGGHSLDGDGPAGSGGNGGPARGSAIEAENDATIWLYLQSSTVSGNTATHGNGGLRGFSGFGGTNGTDGTASVEAVYCASGTNICVDGGAYSLGCSPEPTCPAPP